MSRTVDQWTIPVDLSDPQARGQVIALYNRMMREQIALTERLQVADALIGQQRAVINGLEARIDRQNLALKVAKQRIYGTARVIAEEEGPEGGDVPERAGTEEPVAAERLQCCVLWCERIPTKRGMCATHYSHELRYRDPYLSMRQPDGRTGGNSKSMVLMREVGPDTYQRATAEEEAKAGITRRVSTPPTCSVPWCTREARTRGWCAMHYHRLWRFGDAYLTRRHVAGLQRGHASKLVLMREVGPDQWEPVGSNND